MKRIIALILVLMLVFSGCSVKTKNDVQGTSSSTGRDNSGQMSQPETPSVSPEVVILANAGYGDEAYANVVRDQLAKAGFSPKINMQPDYASFRSMIDAGNFDLAITYWNTVTGSPDYAVRSVWHSEGPLNLYHINDPELDELIELGATQTPDEYMETYEKFEKRLVEEKAYVIPMYVSIKTLALNKTIMKPESVRISKSRSMVWEELDFVDESKRDTEPFVMSQTASDLTPLDPVRSDDGSTFMLNTNCYIRLVNLTDTDEITTDSTLSHNYVIAENGQDFYFLLRDDVNFAKVENFAAVDSGERVGAEDVVYSLERMRNKDVVPDHKNFNNFVNMDTFDIAVDVESLKGVTAKNGKNVLEALEENAPAPITSLTDDKAKADNKNGVYQVVHMTTKFPFPQILNVLAHSSGGIVSKNQIESMNGNFDPATYDIKNDVLYGDQSTYLEGDTYNNSLVCSGPYIAIKKNDYEVIFEKNPGYMPDDKYAPKVKNIRMKFIKDTENAFSALRAGEIYVLYSIPTSKIDLIKSDPNMEFKEIPGNAYNYLAFNFQGKFADENLRKAALYAVNQEEISAVFNNRLIPTYSSITPVLNTGNVLKADPAKSAEYLKKYAESLNQ